MPTKGETVSWEITNLSTHLLALMCVVLLYRTAPCWLQRLAIALFVGAMSVYVLTYALALSPLWREQVAGMLGVAGAIEHIGVLIYVFRLAYRELIECKSSPASFRRS